jgi:hypothetical protein
MAERAREFGDVAKDTGGLEIFEAGVVVLAGEFGEVIEPFREREADAQALLDAEDRNGIAGGHRALLPRSCDAGEGRLSGRLVPRSAGR